MPMIRGSGLWMRVLSSLLLLIATIGFGLQLTPRAYAATTPTADSGFNLTASPLPIDLATTPGKQTSTPLRVQNSGTAPVKIRVSLLKFKASGTNGQPELMRRGPGDSFFDWVSFSKTSFVAQPGVWNEVVMTINPPKGAAFGYYYAVVFSQDSFATPTSPVTGRLHGATATLVLLDVRAPGEKRTLEVTSFTATKKLYEYLPASFSVVVRGTGNVHAVPGGDIFISRNRKSNIAVLPINPNSGNVLPDSSRTFTVDWSDGFPVYATKRIGDQIVSDKKGAPARQLKWNFDDANKFRFGRYYAHMLLTYDDGTKDVPIDAEVAFWVIPWKLILLMILVPLVPAVIVYVIMRQRVKRLRGKRGKYSLNGKTD